jgi:hypothetical protein
VVTLQESPNNPGLHSRQRPSAKLQFSLQPIGQVFAHVSPKRPDLHFVQFASEKHAEQLSVQFKSQKGPYNPGEHMSHLSPTKLDLHP